MKARIFLLIPAFLLAISSFGQQTIDWSKWNWLMGEWKGEGSGQPGQGGGLFRFSFNLDKKIIERKSHSEYPAKGNKPLIIHDDLMIVYPDAAGNPSRAIYFDNEGHTINYTVSYADKSIVLTSEPIPNTPAFRLTYMLLDDNTIDTRFELARDGKTFTTYLEGKSKKVKL
jgi:hypothetical protein